MNEQNSLPALQTNQNYSIAEVQPVSTDSLVKQVQAIQHAMKSVMEDGVHYGKIPGCGEKPALLKPGAEKIGLMFRLGAYFDPQYIDLTGGHREIKVICTLKSILNGETIGQGVGSCSTMESKYRYAGSELELTNIPVPKEFWKDRDINILAELSGFPAKMISTKKDEKNQWVIALKGEKSERKDLADVYNTVLKMAKKRAHVDAIITATAAGDIFTQDIEDMPAIEATVVSTPMVQAVEQVATKAKEAHEDREMPAMAAAHDAGSVSYNIPYKDEAARALAKSHKFRFNKDTKHWDGKVFLPELVKYQVGATGSQQNSTTEQPPAPEFFESDQMPSWEQEAF